MNSKELLETINNALNDVKIKKEIELAKVQSFNEGYERCLLDIKSLLESNSEEKVEQDNKN